jgi:hypothetical protein
MVKVQITMVHWLLYLNIPTLNCTLFLSSFPLPVVLTTFPLSDHPSSLSRSSLLADAPLLATSSLFISIFFFFLCSSKFVCLEQGLGFCSRQQGCLIDCKSCHQFHCIWPLLLLPILSFSPSSGGSGNFILQEEG